MSFCPYNEKKIILVQGFCSLKIKITQFPDGFRLGAFRRKILLIDVVRS